MITNEGGTSHETDVSQPVAQDDTSVLVTTATPVNPTQSVISAYTAAARRGGRVSESAFDAAVRAYMVCYPATHRDAAARIVADIISHRS